MSDQRDAVHLGHLGVTGAENGVVLADVDVAGLGVIVDGLHVGDIGEIPVLAAGGDAGRAELGGFLGGFLAEIAGHQVIRRAGGHKIQRDHGELLGGAALEKADLVVVGDVQHPPHGGLGVRDDLVEPFAAVAHFHHAHAGTVVVQQFLLGGFQNSFRQHRRSGAEIINSGHCVSSFSWVRGGAFRGRRNARAAEYPYYRRRPVRRQAGKIPKKQGKTGVCFCKTANCR